VTYRIVFRLPDRREAAIEVSGDEHLLEAALGAGLDLPYSCLQGWCLTCAARIIDGVVDQQDSRRYFPEDAREGFALLCTGRARSDCVFQTHARDAMRAARDKYALPYPKGAWGRTE
jgi:ferredoxin